MWCHVVVVITTVQLQQSLNLGSAQVQILLAACRRFVMVRISDNGPGLNLSSVDHTTKTINHHPSLKYPFNWQRYNGNNWHHRYRLLYPSCCNIQEDAGPTCIKKERPIALVLWTLSTKSGRNCIAILYHDCVWLQQWVLWPWKEFNIW